MNSRIRRLKFCFSKQSSCFSISLTDFNLSGEHPALLMLNECGDSAVDGGRTEMICRYYFVSMSKTTIDREIHKSIHSSKSSVNCELISRDDLLLIRRHHSFCSTTASRPIAALSNIKGTLRASQQRRWFIFIFRVHKQRLSCYCKTTFIILREILL